MWKTIACYLFKKIKLVSVYHLFYSVVRGFLAMGARRRPGCLLGWAAGRVGGCAPPSWTGGWSPLSELVSLGPAAPPAGSAAACPLPPPAAFPGTPRPENQQQFQVKILDILFIYLYGYLGEYQLMLCYLLFYILNIQLSVLVCFNWSLCNFLLYCVTCPHSKMTVIFTRGKCLWIWSLVSVSKLPSYHFIYQR